MSLVPYGASARQLAWAAALPAARILNTFGYGGNRSVNRSRSYRTGSFKPEMIRNLRKGKTSGKRKRRPRKLRARKRRFVRRRRFNRRKRLLPWKIVNVKTAVAEVGDRITCAATAAVTGKACNYIYTGAQQLGAVAQYNTLMGINHLANIAFSLNNAAPLTLKFIIKKATVRYELSSASVGQINLIAYKCRVRSDMPYQSTHYKAYWIDNLIGQGLYDRGYTTGGVSTSNTGIHQDRFNPFDSPLFCSYIKVVKTVKKTLTPGQIMHFGCAVRNKYINTEKLWQEASGSSTYLNTQSNVAHRAGEQFWLFKFSGQVANDATTKTNVAATAPAMNLMTTFHYEYGLFNTSNPLPTDIGVSGITGGTEEIIDGMTGGVTADNNS